MASGNPQIRNIQQSVQYRDVAKQAPDVVVYIDGQDYLVNPYLDDEQGNPGVAVQFNSFLNSFQATYDVESMIPSGSVTLAVPNYLDYQFRSPGGNHLIQTMAQIQVFAKGYYFSAKGNTVYRQVFHGFISSVGYSTDGKMTTISISCFGSLGIVERMQIDTNPAAISSSTQEITPLATNTAGMSPYKALVYPFVYATMIDGFDVHSIQQAALDTRNVYYQAVKNNFMAKWQVLLYELARDVHIFGAPNADSVLADIAANMKKSDSASAPQSTPHLADKDTQVSTTSEAEQQDNSQPYFQAIRDYLPEMSIGSIQLTNGKVTSRLERIRTLVSYVGYEAYQDIDGGVVMKPPLYNLDVTQVSDPSFTQEIPALADIYEVDNPFVVQLAEILDESESEDEAQIKMTRTTAYGSFNPQFQIDGTAALKTVAEEIDIAKLSQFGLRTEPPKNAAFIADGDMKGLYAYCVAEMAKANRGFRSYTVTIPLRPELKLGFPMYFPHKDVYGYIKNVSLSVNQGSTATMTVSLDTIRRRPMYPVSQPVPSADGKTTETKLLFTPQPNLVLQWTSPPTPAAPSGDLAATLAFLADQTLTLPVPAPLVTDQDKKAVDYRRNKIGNSFGTEPDSVSNCWRVQLDPKAKSGGTFPPKRPITPQYLEDIRKIRPYTDEKGYELVGPFPWGRGKCLKEAIFRFTIDDAIGKGSANPQLRPIDPGTLTLTNAQAFLFTGEATPASASTSAEDLLSSLSAQAAQVSNYKIFELAYDATTPGPSVAGTVDPGQPSNLVAKSAEERAAVFLSSVVATADRISGILSTVEPSLADISVPEDDEATPASPGIPPAIDSSILGAPDPGDTI